MSKALPCTVLTDYDITLMQAGAHHRLYQKMGSHMTEVDGQRGATFVVYAPAARKVSVIGDFNRWQAGIHELFPRWDSSGVWEGFIPGVEPGMNYKYQIESYNGWRGAKADPYGRLHEHPPMTATKIWNDQYTWTDGSWMNERAIHNKVGVAVSIYEMHLASWRRHDNGNPLTYRQMAEQLPSYLQDMGFTHVEFMPVMEHPYDPSWGYQITGYFAPTSRFGTPDDLKYLIDQLHHHGIGVIFDWVPSHFPTDGHGLGYFDGSEVYEHPDKRKGYHPDWKSLIFNYGRNEVKSFLLSNAMFWVDEFHADGLRVDAVASMIYLDYSRNEGEWERNQFGGNEYIEAIDLLKAMNETVYGNHTDVLTIAEESTAFPGVSHPTYSGGLGFGMKWMMGWMHDTLNYFKLDPLFRKHSHHQITFSMVYNYSENYVLPFSHDEVVHGKGSLLSRMPGEGKDQFAQLRLMLGYMFTHPGAKLLFMGCEFGQRSEWNFAGQLDWDVLQYESHQGIRAWVKFLNRLYRTEKSLHELCTKPEGFKWVRIDDWQQSVLAYERAGVDPDDKILVILNLTPVAREKYRIGTEDSGSWELINHSDNKEYWGHGSELSQKVMIDHQAWEEKTNSMEFDLPGLTVNFYKFKPGKKKSKIKSPDSYREGAGSEEHRAKNTVENKELIKAKDKAKAKAKEMPKAVSIKTDNPAKKTAQKIKDKKVVSSPKKKSTAGKKSN